MSKVKKRFQQSNLAFKEVIETILFSIFSNQNTALWFSAHIIRFILFPLAGLTFVINAIIDTFTLITARNKNVDKTLGSVVSMISAGLAVTAIIGTLTFGVFVVGPFLFVAAMSVGLLHQLTMALVNAIRGAFSPAKTAERKDYFESVISSLFNSVLFSFIIATLVGAMITPFSVPAMAAVAAVAVLFTVLKLVWRLMPAEWCERIKSGLGFSASEPVAKPKPLDEHSIHDVDVTSKTMKNEKVESGFFKRAFRKYEMNHQKSAKDYLQREVETKQSHLNDKTDVKSKHKLSVLAHFQDVLENNFLLDDIDTLTHDHPLAFQSFFKEISDMEDLYQAVQVYNERVSSA